MLPRLPKRAPVWDTIEAPHRLSLGLRATQANESWIAIDEDLPRDLLEKHALLSNRREQVLVETPTSRTAQREALDRVTSELLRVYPDFYRNRGGRFVVSATGASLDLDDPSVAPLEAAARCVQEDLVVMEDAAAGWLLTAGVVCFPTRWDLPSKLGRPMAAIHERVPGYREGLAAPANRFFDGMKPGIVFRRGNWSLMDDPALFQPAERSSEDAPGVDRSDPAECGRRIWLRVEHQSLQRLPETGAILFGIRVHRTRLDALAREPTVAARLLRAIDTMPRAMQHYKSLASIRAATTTYLRAAIEAAGI